MKRSSPRGFTLIELLVVIVIVAVLAALSVVGLQRAQRSGKNVACISNLRQLGVAMHQYANDNNGWLVPPKEGAVRWSERLAAYLQSTQSVEVIPTANRGLQRSIFECPAETSSRLKS